MNLRAPRRLTLLALVAPALATVPLADPGAAVRADDPSPVYAVDEWTDGDEVRLPAEPYTRVEVTYGASYGITPDGAVRSAVVSWRPSSLVAPDFERPIVDVAGDAHFGLALDDEGRVQAWGEAPTISADDRAETYRDIAAADGGAIGVTTAGGLRYWGNAAARYSFDPADLVDVEVASIDVGEWGAVALTTEGRVLSGGAPLRGLFEASTPFPAERSADTVTAVDAGVEFAVALTADGEVVSWGSHLHGEDQVPALPAGRRAVAVSAGMWWAAAVLDDGSVVTWGQGERADLPALREGVPVADLDLDRYRSAVTYATLASTSAPLIEGTPRYGGALTASPGSWSPVPDDLHYSWTLQAGGTSRTVGTDSPSYTPTAQDAPAGGTFTVTVTAASAGLASMTATSAETGPLPLPAFTTAPTVIVAGTPEVGHSLTAVTTVAEPAPDTAEVTWFRAPAEEIGEGATLLLTDDLHGADVFATVTASRAGYEPAVVVSDPVTVAAGTLAAPSVSVTGTPRVGHVLTATVTPDAAATGTSYQWLRGSAPIAGATAATYRPVAADLGQRLGVRVVSSAPGYTSATGTSAASTPVTLGAARLQVTVPGKAAVGREATITVRGLGAGERFTVTVAGKRLTGRASRAGVGTVALKVTGKPGRRTVQVVGSVADRAGTATLRVVRRG